MILAVVKSCRKCIKKPPNLATNLQSRVEATDPGKHDDPLPSAACQDFIFLREESNDDPHYESTRNSENSQDGSEDADEEVPGYTLVWVMSSDRPVPRQLLEIGLDDIALRVTVTLDDPSVDHALVDITLSLQSRHSFLLFGDLDVDG